MSTHRPTIVCYGGLVLDLVLQIPRIPLIADEAQMATSLSAEPGGVGNTLITAARLGGESVDVVALGAAGADPNGRQLLEMFRDEAVDVGAVDQGADSSNSLVLVFVDVAGEHVFVVHDGAGETFTMDERSNAAIRSAGVFFVPGFAMKERRMAPSVIDAVACAGAANVPIMNDLGPVCADADLRQAVRAVIAASSVTLLTEAEAIVVTGESSHEDAARTLMSWGCPVVVVKCGADGCTVWQRSGPTAVPAVPVVARDTTGAGDTFAGAFMVDWLQNRDPISAAHYGTAAAAVVVQKIGAGRNCPTTEEVAEVLAS